MKTWKEYKPRKVCFWINTTDKKVAKELGKIDGGNEYDGFDVEVVRSFKTYKQAHKFRERNGGDVYCMRYAGRKFETEEEFFTTKYKRKGQQS